MPISRIAALLLCASLGLALPAFADGYQDGSKLFKQGQHAQALEKVNAFLAANPKDAKARFLKGLILTEQKKEAEALKIFSDLTEDYPELPEPYNNLAVLYAAQGQYEKARTALEAAIRTHPSYATAHENLGDIYAKMATQAYDKALQLDSNNTAAQTKLAMVKELFSGKATRPINIAQAESIKIEKVKPTTPLAGKPATALSSSASPAAKHTETQTPSKSPDETEAILLTVNAWAQAWSDKNVAAYLGFYAKDFRVPGGTSRSSWDKSRKERILGPKQIQVSVISPDVRFSDPTHAKVKFKQNYRSDNLKVQAGKTLVMVKADGRWLIVQEQVGK